MAGSKKMSSSIYFRYQNRKRLKSLFLMIKKEINQRDKFLTLSNLALQYQKISKRPKIFELKQLKMMQMCFRVKNRIKLNLSFQNFRKNNTLMHIRMIFLQPANIIDQGCLQHQTYHISKSFRGYLNLKSYTLIQQIQNRTEATSMPMKCSIKKNIR